MRESDLWLIGFVVAVIAVIAGEIAISLKGRKWYILPILFALPTAYTVFEFFRSDGWDSLAWLFIFAAAAGLFLASLLGALAGLLVRRHREKKTGRTEA